jgi:sec-independent protein translocase protein TatA
VGIESPVHLLFIAAVALVVLGPKRLPEVARALGKGIREFREAMSEEAAHSASPHTPARGDPGTGSFPEGEPARTHAPARGEAATEHSTQVQTSPLTSSDQADPAEPS